jgi:hypothetical protein
LKQFEMKMQKQWPDLSPEEKREERFKNWLSPSDVKFSSPEAERAYKARVTRLIDAIKLKEPDRVPVQHPMMFYPAYYAGLTLQTVMYNYSELRRAWLNVINDFDMDTYSAPGIVVPGRVYEMLDYKLYKWPGHGLAADVSSYQCVEGEYMKADEYDALIRDPSDFWMRFYLPRIFGAFEPFRRLSPITNDICIATTSFVDYGEPDIQAAFQALLEAGREMTKWRDVIVECSRAGIEAGFPALRGSMAYAPFDRLADTLRGTRGIMLDMYRQPDKLLEAIERIIPLTIENAVSGANASGGLTVGFPLHKGDDTFMSDKQFETFYWPSLKKVILSVIDEGLIPMLFAEGIYNRRLEVIKDLPRGSVIWYFDKTDMARAKEVLGDTACIAGNVPTSLLCTGIPQAVKEYCRQLIKVCGKGGGFILTSGAPVNEGDPENLRAMMAAAKEYGRYR